MCSNQGRDAGRLYIVVEILDEEFVRVSDGQKKPLSRSKKKNIKHLQKYNKFISKDLIAKLTNKKASDRELRFEVEDFKSQIEAE